MATIDIIVESGVASALLDTVAPKDSPTFSGNVFLPSTTTIGSVDPTEISYLDGLTGNIQSQINGISVTDPITGNIYLPVKSGTAGSIVFEGTEADDFELTLSPGAGQSSDVTVTIPATVTTTLVGTENEQILKNKTFEYPNRVLAGLKSYASTATASGTTTLTNISSHYQQFTGTLTQTVKLPVTSSLATGWSFHIVNNSTGDLSVQSSGSSSNAVITIPSGTAAMVTCIGITLTTAADWEAGLTDFSTYTGSGSVVLSNSPTLTLPTTIGTTGSPVASTFTGIFTIPYSSSTSGIKNVVGAPVTPTYWTQNNGTKALSTVSASTNYPIFTNSTLTLRADTVYKFECSFQLTASGTLTGTTTSFDLIGGGTLTGASISWSAIGGISTLSPAIAASTASTPIAATSTTSSAIFAASVTTSYVRTVLITGTIRVPSGTTSLTIIPSVSFSAAQASVTQTIASGAYMTVSPIGSYSDYQAGGWS